MAQKSNSQGTLMTDFGINIRPMLALKVSKEALILATIFYKIFYQNDYFLRNSEPLKISLLQCYEALWIHNIDAICTAVNVLTK